MGPAGKMSHLPKPTVHPFFFLNQCCFCIPPSFHNSLVSLRILYCFPEFSILSHNLNPFPRFLVSPKFCLPHNSPSSPTIPCVFQSYQFIPQFHDPLTMLCSPTVPGLFYSSPHFSTFFFVSLYNSLSFHTTLCFHFLSQFSILSQIHISSHKSHFSPNSHYFPRFQLFSKLSVSPPFLSFLRRRFPHSSLISYNSPFCPTILCFSRYSQFSPTSPSSFIITCFSHNSIFSLLTLSPQILLPESESLFKILRVCLLKLGTAKQGRAQDKRSNGSWLA